MRDHAGCCHTAAPTEPQPVTQPECICPAVANTDATTDFNADAQPVVLGTVQCGTD